MSSTRQELQIMVGKWQKAASRDATDTFKYEDLLDDLLYQADVRFRDYVQFEEDGPFPYRLRKWLDNGKTAEEQKTMFRLLNWLIFIDAKQTQSLYRHAYRTNIVAWASTITMESEDLTAPDYHRRLISLMHQLCFCSITQSFDTSLFMHINSLVGLPKIEMLGERPALARDRVAKMVSNEKKRGMIILEDMVGTGNQAARVLCKISSVFPENWHCLFVPLIILDSGLHKLQALRLPHIDISPVLRIPATACVRQKPQKGEPREFQYTRALLKQTQRRVLEQLHEHDDAPKDVFGFEGSGALVVTSHNTPNNTIPLIHHRAPDWFPLFRRVHHLGDE